LTRGRWGIGEPTAALLAEQVAAPSPTYVSLQSALFRHGVIEQVPGMTYAATLGRARKIRTPRGTVSVHRIPPELFGGFELADDGAKVATVEKALFDLIYLSPTRSRLFVKLPETEFPRSFKWAETNRWAKLIRGKSRRAFVEKKLAEMRQASERQRADA